MTIWIDVKVDNINLAGGGYSRCVFYIVTIVDLILIQIQMEIIRLIERWVESIKRI
jgi:hypothetical protein